MMLEYFNQNKNLNLWNELYEPMILEQAKILLLQQWDTVFDRVRAEIDTVTKKMTENRYVQLSEMSFEYCPTCIK